MIEAIDQLQHPVTINSYFVSYIVKEKSQSGIGYNDIGYGHTSLSAPEGTEIDVILEKAMTFISNDLNVDRHQINIIQFNKV